jgi:hypothetical protein
LLFAHVDQCAINIKKNNFHVLHDLPHFRLDFQKIDALFSLLFRADRRCYLLFLLSSHKLPAFSSEIVKIDRNTYLFLRILKNA